MQAITIGTAEHVEEIRERLLCELRFLQDEGVSIRIGQTNRGKFTFLDCSISPDSGSLPERETLMRHHVANALSDVIVEAWEQDLIRRIIRTSYSYFSKDEQDLILGYTGKNLGGAGAGVDGVNAYKASRKSAILHRLRDYLDSADELVLEGFVTFRMRDYMEELEDAVDRAVDDFLMEREYREFVRLLKYFVDVQEPRVDNVHVVIRPGGTFRLLDDEGSAMRSEYLEEFVVEMVESEVNYEDLLISALITLAPRRVTIHGNHRSPEWSESLETIKNVFVDRVDLCDACPVCTEVVLREEPPQATLSH